MEVPFFLSAYKRTGKAELATVNCLVEMDEEGKPMLLARPGTESFATIGTAPIRLMFQKEGLFSSSAVIVADDTLYTLTAEGAETAYTGTIAGTGLLEADGGLDADYNSIIRMATGDALYKGSSETNTVVEEDFPSSGGAGATSVGFLAGYWLATEAGSDAVYYQIPAATTWNALQFASAEYAPDPNVCVRVVGEVAWLMGKSSLEGWRATGNSSSPLEPVGGLKFDIGCRQKSAAVNCRGTLVFVDSDCAVRMTSGSEPRIISEPWLAEQIRRTDAADLRASFFVKDQHPCYVLTLGATATYIFDLSTERWTGAKTQGYDYWRNDLFCNIGDVALARETAGNGVVRLDPDLKTDAGTTFTMEWCAFVEAKERSVPIANVQLRCAVGESPLSGQGSDPLVVMRVSRDGTRTWGDPKQRGLGTTGDYNKRVRWSGQGTAPAPHGAYLKFSVSDPVIRRVSGVSVNAP